MIGSSDADAIRASDAFARGDFETAYHRASNALKVNPAARDSRLLRANAALALERWQEALSDVGQLLGVDPNNLEVRNLHALCWLRIGNARKASGDRGAAIVAYQNAARSAPKQVQALLELGSLLLETGNARDALPLLATVAQDLPDDVDLALKLAEAELACGELDSAARRLVEWQSRPSGDSTKRRCAELLLRARCDDAATAMATAIACAQSDAWDWCWQFAGHVRAKGDVDASRAVLSALRDAQDDPALRLRAELALALGLPAVYASTADLHNVRTEYLARLQNFIDEYSPHRLTRIAPTPDQLSWENFYLAYQGENDLSAQSMFGQWLAQSLVALLPDLAVAPTPPLRTRPRLALVSSRFHDCTVGLYFASWVEYLAKCNWELVLVHVGTIRDALTERLKHAAHAELTLSGTALAEDAARLRELAADIIIYPELGMDRCVLALAALPLAPRQVCAWGHPVTSGLPTIDAFLSCAEMEPADAAEHYRERLITLPGLGTRYSSPPLPPAVSRRQLGLPEQRTLYLVPQALFKLHPDNDSVLVDIVRLDPDALFVLFELRSPSPIRRMRERLLHALAQASAQPQHHLHWFAECSREDYLRINRACDVMVDSLHWSGGNASLDALHCGLPVITCPGAYMRGRQSAAMLRALDCAELIAQSPRQLAQIAVCVAHDSQRRAGLAARILANLPALTQSNAPLQALDRALGEILTQESRMQPAA
jgi:predicted O-linked N-acetylglucosamine transferase (SPINDLY family)